MEAQLDEGEQRRFVQLVCQAAYKAEAIHHLRRDCGVAGVRHERTNFSATYCQCYNDLDAKILFRVSSDKEMPCYFAAWAPYKAEHELRHQPCLRAQAF